MTNDEKAKAYDEAFERAKQIRNGNPSSGTAIVVCEQIFPQLLEIEDERIRRTLVEYFGPQAQLDFIRGVPIQKIRDWLERKKIPSVSFNPALGFDPGSAVVYHNDGSEEETTRKELLDFVRSFWADHKEKLPQASRWVTYLEKQKGIPMPDSTTLLKMWEEVEAMLKEHEDDPYWGTWRIAYNAFLEGFGKGFMVKRDYFEKQKDID